MALKSKRVLFLFKALIPSEGYGQDHIAYMFISQVCKCINNVDFDKCVMYYCKDIAANIRYHPILE